MRNDDMKKANDVRRDFENDDDALWALLGILEDEKMPHGFLDETVDKVRREESAARAWWTRPWVAGGGLVAAALLVAVFVMGLGQGDSSDVQDTSEGDRIAAQTEFNDVVNLLDALGADDIADLDALDAEADEDAYIGG